MERQRKFEKSVRVTNFYRFYLQEVKYQQTFKSKLWKTYSSRPHDWIAHHFATEILTPTSKQFNRNKCIIISICTEYHHTFQSENFLCPQNQICSQGNKRPTFMSTFSLLSLLLWLLLLFYFIGCNKPLAGLLPKVKKNHPLHRSWEMEFYWREHPLNDWYHCAVHWSQSYFIHLTESFYK